MTVPLKVLKEHFGYSTFKGLQEPIINRIVDEQKHSLVLMPTGGGKALCYQIPALIFEGGTLVISPRIALMQDQVDALRKRNIPASFINSTVSRNDRTKRLNDLAIELMGKKDHGTKLADLPDDSEDEIDSKEGAAKSRR